MTDPALTDRLHAVLSARNLREIAAITGVHHETVRRYLLGHSPSAAFLTAVCTQLRVNGHWLLTGQGPISLDDAPFLLRGMPPSTLLEALMTSLNGVDAEFLETPASADPNDASDAGDGSPAPAHHASDDPPP
ncbi:MAG: hypothetical protein H6811_06805 [Phycisphaeraceae bacterium]|nr:hypothetical protein [Phycisphaeraceae bacterium]